MATVKTFEIFLHFELPCLTASTVSFFFGQQAPPDLVKAPQASCSANAATKVCIRLSVLHNHLLLFIWKLDSHWIAHSANRAGENAVILTANPFASERESGKSRPNLSHFPLSPEQYMIHSGPCSFSMRMRSLSTAAHKRGIFKISFLPPTTHHHHQNPISFSGNCPVSLSVLRETTYPSTIELQMLNKWIQSLHTTWTF